MGKTIKDYPRYTVNECGVVFDKASNRVLKQPLAGYGLKYPRVMLVNESGIRKSVYVHRLVAKAFIPEIEGKPHVNHIDGNKLNNHYSNLEWCTNQENLAHAHRTGLVNYNFHRPGNQNFKNYIVRKPVIQLTKDGQFVKEWESIVAAEKALGIKDSKISSVARKYRNYTSCAGYRWEFKEVSNFVVSQ